jgi:hypothetical protein
VANQVAEVVEHVKLTKAARLNFCLKIASFAVFKQQDDFVIMPQDTAGRLGTFAQQQTGLNQPFQHFDDIFVSELLAKQELGIELVKRLLFRLLNVACKLGGHTLTESHQTREYPQTSSN